MTTYLILRNIKIIQNSMVFLLVQNWLFERILWLIGTIQNIKSTKEKSERNKFVYDNDSDLCNSLLVDYDQQYSDCSYRVKKNKGSKHNFSDLFLDDLNIIITSMKNQKLLKRD